MSRDYKHKRSPPPGGAPGWVWLLVGLFIGLAVAAVVHMRGQQSSAPSGAAQEAAQEDASDELDSDGGGFTFYHLLPSFEVVIPEEETAIGAGADAAVLVEPGLYVVQAGSFQQEEDADRRRAELALMGIESEIQRVTVDDRRWHRVRIGPHSDLDRINRIRGLLRDRGIEMLVIRVGD
jgi:sporulation related protein